MAASDLGGDGLCVWTAAGGDAAGGDTSLRAARAALAWRRAGHPLACQRADAGPAGGAEFVKQDVRSWWQKRKRPVFRTRKRPYKKDDKAHVEQKNWTHIRQCFGYERHDNPEVVAPINALVKGAYGQLHNYFHASLKLEGKERKERRVRRIYGEAQTPLPPVLPTPHSPPQTKHRLRPEHAAFDPLALQ